jgi:tripartite-type tricarboxylate transporter receptor subunit TctC
MADQHELRTNQGKLGRRPVLKTLAAALAVPGLTHAQERFPSRQIRILCGSPAGSLSDVLARLIGQRLGESLGQPVAVDNRPGANGMVVADAVAKAAPDGYTMMLVPDTVVVTNQYVYPRLPYNPETAHQPIALLGRVAVLLVVNPATRIRNFADFTRTAKIKPVTFGSGGIGHPTHLWGELVANRLGLQLKHVPYKGTAPAVQAVAAGEIDFLIVGLAEAMPLIKAGKIRAIASSGPGAKEAFPDLPLLREAHADLDVTAWFGFFGPGAMRAEVVALVNREINKALRHPETVKRLADFGLVPQPSAPGALNEVIRADRRKYGPLVTTLGIRAE